MARQLHCHEAASPVRTSRKERGNPTMIDAPSLHATEEERSRVAANSGRHASPDERRRAPSSVVTFFPFKELGP